jgi:hypothetical protein
MKGTDLPDSVATIPAAGNGTHRLTKTSRAASNRSAGRRAGSDVRSAPKPLAAPLATPETPPVDVPAWCLHPAIWFQPELAPSTPGWSGLAIERCSRIPAPDFLHSLAEAYNLPDSLDSSRDALTPAARPKIPQSASAPLAWDPRAVCRKGEHE